MDERMELLESLLPQLSELGPALGIVGSSVVVFLILSGRARRFTQPDGSMKRGVPVWRSAVSVDEREGLAALPEGMHLFPWGWARVEGPTLLVFADCSHPELSTGKSRKSTSAPYVLRVDRTTGVLTWRQPLRTVVFLLPFLYFSAFMAIAIAVFNHQIQKAACQRALAWLAQWRPDEEGLSETPSELDDRSAAEGSEDELVLL